MPLPDEFLQELKLRTDIEYSLSKFAIFHTFSEFVHVAI